jgi:hypothetical protein
MLPFFAFSRDLFIGGSGRFYAQNSFLFEIDDGIETVITHEVTGKDSIVETCRDAPGGIPVRASHHDEVAKVLMTSSNLTSMMVVPNWAPKRAALTFSGMVGVTVVESAKKLRTVNSQQCASVTLPGQDPQVIGKWMVDVSATPLSYAGLNKTLHESPVKSVLDILFIARS